MPQRPHELEGLLALTPSEATTLSRFEATDLLRRLSVERAVEPAVTLEVNTPVARAGEILLERDALEGLVVERRRPRGHPDSLGPASRADRR